MALYRKVREDYEKAIRMGHLHGLRPKPETPIPAATVISVETVSSTTVLSAETLPSVETIPSLEAVPSIETVPRSDNATGLEPSKKRRKQRV
jgi:hypothetical protein